MKKRYFMFCFAILCLFPSFTPSEACSYLDSNMTYVQTQTNKAIEDHSIDKAKFYIYKAIKTIQKSSTKISECGCKDAEDNILKSLLNLKAAARAKSINGSKTLLKESLQNIYKALSNIAKHENHDYALVSKELKMENSISNQRKSYISKYSTAELHRKIDISLQKFEASLNVVVDSLNCIDAYKFTKRVFEECEKELLKNNLSEGKKYYNLKTQQIASEALSRLGNCENQKANN